MTPHSWLWGPDLFESLSLPQVNTSSAESSWLVQVRDNDLAWGYCIELPGESLNNILWRVKIEVHATEGDVSPGIALHDFNDGFMVQVNETSGTAELRYLLTKKETICMEATNLPARAGHYFLAIEYNALTHNCTCSLDENPLFEVKLPYKRIPALSSIAAMEIVTTTPLDAKNEGFVRYGNLYLDSE